MLRQAGVEPSVVSSSGQLQAFDQVILPGVGHFGAAMRRLTETGLADDLRKYVAEDRPLLGICLGMQLLSASSEESVDGHPVEGLGIVPCRVVHLGALGCTERVPHVGWNGVEVTDSGRKTFKAIPNQADFYFVHSYAVDPGSIRESDVTSYTTHSVRFVSSLRFGEVWGVQFHPEKSSHFGRLLITTFLELSPSC